jgi:hypothetical protein
MNKLPIILSVMSLLLLSCEAGKPPAKPAPVNAQYTLEITPKDPMRNSTLILISKGFNLPEAVITWMVNGQPVADVSGPRITVSEVQKGDTVQASASVAGVAVLSDTVEIKNSPPEITSVNFMPETFKPGDDALSVGAEATDPDGDAVSLSYEWIINGQSVGTGSRLEAKPKRGDKIFIKVIPFDGTDYGSAVTMEKTIVNMPPVIFENKEGGFDGSTYSYQVKASDPDGDTLTYSLESPPAGMTIDPSSGLLKWVVPQEFKGVKNATINVNDGNGGNTKYSITITIK